MRQLASVIARSGASVRPSQEATSSQEAPEAFPAVFAAGRLSQGDFNRGGTMCQHLCRIHLAPKSSASRPELIESLLYFVHGYLIEEILHITLQRILLVQRKLFDTKSCPWLPSDPELSSVFRPQTSRAARLYRDYWSSATKATRATCSRLFRSDLNRAMARIP